ncbi:MAG: AbiJ-NTD4 domain-containing protein [Leptospirillum sp.]
MRRFSERKGYIKVSDAFQKDGINDALLNSLWNVLCIHLWETEGYLIAKYGSPSIEILGKGLWIYFFKKPIDTMPIVRSNYAKKHNGGKILAEIRNFFFNAEWFLVYDFVEFICQFHSKDSRFLNLPNAINQVLERELAGYRLISGKIVDITDKQELHILEEALQEQNPIFSGVAEHLQRALELFADRKNPDYRNSIKESISAVESMMKVITGNPQASLEDGLNHLKENDKLPAHKALHGGWMKLYGYTSDAGGIRHALIADQDPGLGIDEARYFLLSCTSFTNYLKTKLVVCN